MMKKKKFKKSQILLIYITVGVLVVLSFDRFFISGIQSRFKSSRDRVKFEEVRLEKNLNVQREKDVILKNYEMYKHYLEKGPDSGKQIIAELLREVENIVTAVGGVIVNLNPYDEPREIKYYKRYSVEFRLEVSFEQMLRFLDKVGRSKLLIKLDKLTVIAVNKRANILRVDGVVSLAVPN